MFMLFQDSTSDIELCVRLFPNLIWEIETSSTNHVLYEGKSNVYLSLQIEGSLEGYRGFLSWNDDVTIISTDLPSTSLLATLQEIKTEWHKIARVMNG